MTGTAIIHGCVLEDEANSINIYTISDGKHNTHIPRGIRTYNLLVQNQTLYTLGGDTKNSELYIHCSRFNEGVSMGITPLGIRLQLFYKRNVK